MRAPLGWRTQPRCHLALTGLVVPFKTARDSPCVELVGFFLKITELAATAAPAGERARRRFAGAPEMRARSWTCAM